MSISTKSPQGEAPGPGRNQTCSTAWIKAACRGGTHLVAFACESTMSKSEDMQPFTIQHPRHKTKDALCPILTPVHATSSAKKPGRSIL